MKQTSRYMRELQVEGWCCCSNYCLLGLDPHMIVTRSTIWGAKEPEQRDKDLQALIGWCKTWAADGNEAYELRLFGRWVCARAFACAHGNCARTFERKRRHYDEVVGDHAPPSMSVKRRRTGLLMRGEHCALWLRDTLSRMAQPMPNRTVRGRNGEVRTREFLPSGIFSTLNDVYNFYRGHALAQSDVHGVEERPASFATFRRAWIANHFHVSRSRFLCVFCNDGGCKRVCGPRTRLHHPLRPVSPLWACTSHPSSTPGRPLTRPPPGRGLLPNDAL